MKTVATNEEWMHYGSNKTKNVVGRSMEDMKVLAFHTDICTLKCLNHVNALLVETYK